ncbi:MAG: hypothetical protein JNM23_00955 [Bradyrhizobiaceae bacterium]|nr:hypothetical protein [Bradyrhizobiaceae bacterium]
MRPRFLPSARTTNWLLTIGFAALLGAFYLRYLVVENSTVGLACDAGRDSAVCHARFVASRLFRAQVFGFVALGAALLNLIRPALPLFAIAIVATAFGLVLYNTSLAGLAAGLMVMSFARPAREQE